MSSKKPSRKPTHSSKPKRSPAPVAAAKPRAVRKPAAAKSVTAIATTTKPAKSVQASALVPVITVTHEQIASRAYEIWVAKGYPSDQDAQNWVEAEQQLQAEIAG